MRHADEFFGKRRHRGFAAVDELAHMLRPVKEVKYDPTINPQGRAALGLLNPVEALSLKAKGKAKKLKKLLSKALLKK